MFIYQLNFIPNLSYVTVVKNPIRESAPDVDPNEISFSTEWSNVFLSGCVREIRKFFTNSEKYPL